MSVRVMNQVWEDAVELAGSELLVMLALADWCNDEGICWPSMERLALKARIGRATCYRVVAALQEAGYVERSSRPGHSSVFRIHPAPPPDEGVSDRDGSRPDTPRGPAGETGGVSPVRHRTTSEPPEDPSDIAPPVGDADGTDPQGSLIPLPHGPVSAHRRTRQRDLVWEELLSVCGIDPHAAIPAEARGAYNRAVKSLKDAGASPEEITRRGAIFRATWPDVRMTPTALVRRWAEVGTYVGNSAAHDVRRGAEVEDLRTRMQRLDAEDEERRYHR